MLFYSPIKSQRVGAGGRDRRRFFFAQRCSKSSSIYLFLSIYFPSLFFFFFFSPTLLALSSAHGPETLESLLQNGYFSPQTRGVDRSFFSSSGA